jgi:hypothetical protein
LSENEGAQSGPWKIEPGTKIGPEGATQIVRVVHERNDPIYVEHEELADLLGAIMLYLGVQKIEAAD